MRDITSRHNLTEAAYSNPYLKDFLPVYEAILKEKKMDPATLHLEIIDEEAEERSIFETAGIDEVLEQLAPVVNFLTLYTKRPEHFMDFLQRCYEENGLIVEMLDKKALKNPHSGGEKGQILVLDFEWEGDNYFSVMEKGKYYIPIHKKPWKIAENLDIAVPFGYNTVIVKSRQMKKKKPVRDRFEEAFYSE